MNSPWFVYRELERDIDQPVFIYLVSLSRRQSPSQAVPAALSSSPLQSALPGTHSDAAWAEMYNLVAVYAHGSVR